MVTKQPDLNYYEKWEEILPLGLFLLRSKSWLFFFFFLSCIHFESILPSFFLMHIYCVPVKQWVLGHVSPVGNTAEVNSPTDHALKELQVGRVLELFEGGNPLKLLNREEDI